MSDQRNHGLERSEPQRWPAGAGSEVNRYNVYFRAEPRLDCCNDSGLTAAINTDHRHHTSAARSASMPRPRRMEQSLVPVADQPEDGRPATPCPSLNGVVDAASGQVPVDAAAEAALIQSLLTVDSGHKQLSQFRGEQVCRPVEEHCAVVACC